MKSADLESIPSDQLRRGIDLICRELRDPNDLLQALWILKQRILYKECQSLDELSLWKDESLRLLQMSPAVDLGRRKGSQEAALLWSQFFRRCHHESWPVPDPTSFYDSVMETVDLEEEDLARILIRGTKITLANEHLEELREQRHLKTLLNVMAPAVAIAPPQDAETARFFLLAFAAKDLLP